MQRSHALLILSAAIASTAVAWPQQQDQPAEAVYKNIVAMKGTKASDVIPAMQYFSAALNVQCTFCHEETDYAADTKDAKRAARSMIAMQNDINAKHFAGNLEVTCATCHNGNSRPNAFSPAKGAEVRARRNSKIVVADVLSAYGTAANGSDLAKGYRVEGVSENRGVTGSFTGAYAGSNFVFNTKTPQFESAAGFTGTDAWFNLPGKGIVHAPLDHVQEYLNERAIFLGPDTLPKLTSPIGGTATIEGKDFNTVSGGLEGTPNARVTLFFDQKTNLLARAAFTYRTLYGPIAQVNEYRDYQKVGNAMFPMTVINHSADKDLVLTFKSVKPETLPASTFDAPK
jgi:hypothetical protein